MKSPCKDCPRRKVGCHNVDTCPEWREYVKANQALKDKIREDTQHGTDWEHHKNRHGIKSTQKKYGR